ncbi:MAG: ester cyclase [Candidatus Binatia bacterium]|nr:ester cyclase [Candidatus Binatia bacterium]
MNFAWAHMWITTFAHSADKVVELYADPFLFEDLLLGQRISDKDELRRAFKVFENTDPPGPAGINHFEVLRYTGDARYGVIEWQWHCRHVGEFLGVPAAGKETLVRGITFHTYENGKIVREATFWDAATALRQLGVLKPTVEFWKVRNEPASER